MKIIITASNKLQNLLPYTETTQLTRRQYFRGLDSCQEENLEDCQGYIEECQFYLFSNLSASPKHNSTHLASLHFPIPPPSVWLTIHLINQISCPMATLINLASTPPVLSLIKTVTQILPYKHSQIIVVGHSPESLKRLEVIYEIHDVSTSQTLQTGVISKFGVIFLTPYVSHDQPGAFLILASSMGSKKILREGFGLVESRPLVREIHLQRFQQKSLSQTYTLYYSQSNRRVFLLQQLRFGEQQSQVFLRGYEEENEVLSYRIIALEQQVPQVVCSPKRIIFICGSQITLYKERFEPQYFALSNMEQFEILGFYNEFLLQLKEDGSVFTMSLGGALRPLLEEPVTDCWLSLDRLYLLIQGSGIIKVFRVKDRLITEETQLHSHNAAKILFANAEQIILGLK